MTSTLTKLEAVKAALERITKGKIPGGKGARAVGQFYYQDRLDNTKRVAEQALATLDEVMKEVGNPPLYMVDPEKIDEAALDKAWPQPGVLIVVPEDGGWRPIETAPRDYRWLLIGAFDQDGKPNQIVASRWETDFWQFWRGSNPPSHWMPLMPLPQPPAESEVV